MPKPTHIITDNTRHHPLGNSAAVYGDEDLKRRLAAAKDLGVNVTVKKAK